MQDAAVYCVLVLLLVVPALAWLLRNSGDPVHHPKPVPLSPAEQRHADLLQARRDLERQIEILLVPAGTGGRDAPPDTRREMRELQQVLAGINQELAATPARSDLSTS